LIEITVKEDDKVIARGLICDKFKFGIITNIETWIKDEENKKELESEKPLGSSR